MAGGAGVSQIEVEVELGAMGPALERARALEPGVMEVLFFAPATRELTVLLVVVEGKVVLRALVVVGCFLVEAPEVEEV